MEITDLRVHPVAVDIEQPSWTAHEYKETATLTVFEARTDEGIRGYGEVQSGPQKNSAHTPAGSRRHRGYGSDQSRQCVGKASVGDPSAVERNRRVGRPPCTATAGRTAPDHGRNRRHRHRAVGY